MSSRHSNQEHSSIYESNRSRRQQSTPSNQQEPLNSSPSHSDQASKACCFCWCCCCSCSWYGQKFLVVVFFFFFSIPTIRNCVSLYFIFESIAHLYIIVVIFLCLCLSLSSYLSICLALDVGLFIIAHSQTAALHLFIQKLVPYSSSVLLVNLRVY